ncbi:MAG: CRISPR-associated protein Cas4 [Ignisphaera sp.]
MIPITIIKEYTYCPRIAYFKIFTILEPPTESMMYARESRPSLQNIYEAIKHKLSDRCCIEVDRYVYSNRLGIHGYVDALAICDKEAIPIEIKLRSSPKAIKRYALHHVVQLVSYAIAVEETINKPVYRAIILSLEPRSVFEIAISPNIREIVYRSVKEIHKMIAEEKLPRSTPSKTRCSICFYRNICINV